MTKNIVSISGGKDSTATLLVAVALEVDNLQAVFADTGHEHPATYEYVEYLKDAIGVPNQETGGYDYDVTGYSETERQEGGQ